MRIIAKFKYFLFKMIASYKASRIHPHDIKLNISEIIASGRKVSLAVIDDHGFPSKSACEDRGYEVTVLEDFFQSNKRKNSPIDVSHFDILLIDINDVGNTVYPQMQGLGVIERIRNEHPFKIIVAYTGNTGQIHRHKKGDLVDAIFSKEWDEDDILINLNEVKKILYNPKSRWDFIEKRLRNAGANEEQIGKVRFSFVRTVYFLKLTNKNGSINNKYYESIIKDAESTIIDESLIHLGSASFTIARIAFPILGKLNGS